MKNSVKEIQKIVFFTPKISLVLSYIQIIIIKLDLAFIKFIDNILIIFMFEQILSL